MLAAIPDHVPAHLVRPEGWYGLSDLAGDPNASFAAVYEGPPVMYIPANARNPYGTWVLTRHDDIRSAFSDSDHFTSHHIAGFNILANVETLLIPVELDPPDHARYRAFLTPFFGGKAVKALHGTMRAGVVDVIDEIAPLGEADLVPHAFRMMAAVWCALMGAPIERADLYIRFLSQMIHQFDPAIRLSCARDMLAAMKDLYRENKGKTGPGLIRAFINSEIGGAPPTEADCAGLILFMFLAGMDTMAATTAWTLRYLALNPEKRQELIASPTLIPDFLEEMLRRFSIVSSNRFVKRDVEIGGVMLRRGDNVLLSTPLACMDPSVFDNPREVVPNRPQRHLAFGAGAHYCIGASIARAQLPIMLEEWLKRIPRFSIKPGVQLTAHVGDVTGLDALPLVWS
jgi:cytochrome P450